jgi:hypothetical protein
MGRAGLTYVTHEQFVMAWRKAACTDDVAAMTGLSIDYIRKRAQQLRKLGVILPYKGQIKMREPDIGKLNKLLWGDEVPAVQPPRKGAKFTRMAWPGEEKK